jgi:nucleoid DNA-binding protein
VATKQIRVGWRPRKLPGCLKSPQGPHHDQEEHCPPHCRRTGRTELETKPIVQKTFDAIINVLAAQGRVELRNFGVFAVKKRKPRPARNPRTGEKVTVGERVTVTFKPGRVVEERVAMEHRRGTMPVEGLVPDE